MPGGYMVGRALSLYRCPPSFRILPHTSPQETPVNFRYLVEIWLKDWWKIKL